MQERKAKFEHLAQKAAASVLEPPALPGRRQSKPAPYSLPPQVGVGSIAEKSRYEFTAQEEEMLDPNIILQANSVSTMDLSSN